MTRTAMPTARLVLHEGELLQTQQLHERIAGFSPEDHGQDFLAQAVEELLALKVMRNSTTLFDEVDEEPGVAQAISVVEPWGTGQFRVRNLVGSAQLPHCGLQVEILPKLMVGTAADDEQRRGQHRATLMRMWQFAADLQLRDDDRQAPMEMAQLPLHEWLVQRFLRQVQALLSRGLRFEYIEREDNQTTARGRLMVGANMRINALAPHRFYCRFEELSPDRPENRLIRSALDRVMQRTANVQSRRTAASLADWMHDVPPSRRIAHDLSLWRDDRLMAHYKEIRSTCRWILEEQVSSPVSGKQAMFGRFVRMNDVFERYVARWMAQQLCSQQGNRFKLLDQTSGDSRARKELFMPNGLQNPMKPDMLLFGSEAQSGCLAILDAKWKQPDVRELASRADLYQIYAYASHWLADGGGDRVVALVYPQLHGTDLRHPQPFSFPNLKGVQGMALWFQLPAWNGNRWTEGFIIDEKTAPDWLQACHRSFTPPAAVAH